MTQSGYPIVIIKENGDSDFANSFPQFAFNLSDDRLDHFVAWFIMSNWQWFVLIGWRDLPSFWRYCLFRCISFDWSMITLELKTQKRQILLQFLEIVIFFCDNHFGVVFQIIFVVNQEESHMLRWDIRVQFIPRGDDFKIISFASSNHFLSQPSCN